MSACRRVPKYRQTRRNGRTLRCPPELRESPSSRVFRSASIGSLEASENAHDNPAENARLQRRSQGLRLFSPPILTRKARAPQPSPGKQPRRANENEGDVLPLVQPLTRSPRPVAQVLANTACDDMPCPRCPGFEATADVAHGEAVYWPVMHGRAVARVTELEKNPRSAQLLSRRASRAAARRDR